MTDPLNIFPQIFQKWPINHENLVLYSIHAAHSKLSSLSKAHAGSIPYTVLEIVVSMQTLSDHISTLSDPKKLGSDIWLNSEYNHFIYTHIDVTKLYVHSTIHLNKAEIV